jgi:hypothetical protein
MPSGTPSHFDPMKNYKFQIKNWARAAVLLHFAFCIFNCQAQMTIVSTNLVMIGTTNDTTINVKAVNNPIVWQGRVYRLPVNGTNFTTTNGVGTIALVPGKYIGAYAGIPQSFQFNVTNTSTTLNLVDLIESGHGTVFYSGVETIEGTGGLVVTPPTGAGGHWILDGSTISVSAGVGNVRGSTNSTAGTFPIYRDSHGVITNNLLGVTYGPSSFDAAGNATAATNGWPWGALYDPAGRAVAVTNGYPWGTLYDPAGRAVAVTNGYPWGTLYDASGSATAATNGWPWGSLYDPAGRAVAVTNGYPWGTLYDAAGAALAATNGINTAAYWPSNHFATTNPATTSVLGPVKVDGSTITVATDGTISSTGGGGGSGSVSSVGMSVPQGFSISGSPVTTAGTLALARNGGNDNMLGGGLTNARLIAATNQLIVGGFFPSPTNVFQVDTLAGAKKVQFGTNGNAYFSGDLFTPIIKFTGAGTTNGTASFWTNYFASPNDIPHGNSVLYQWDGSTYTPSLGITVDEIDFYRNVVFNGSVDVTASFIHFNGGYIGLGAASPADPISIGSDGSVFFAHGAFGVDTSGNVTANGMTLNTFTVTTLTAGSVVGSGVGLTNLVTWSNPGSTNISVVFSNRIQTITLTNAPKDVFFTFSMAPGCNGGSFAALCVTNTTIHLPYPIKWFLGMSNSVVTNGWLEFDSAGGTNYGQVWGSIGEGM